jgi:CheY-like chemotaxis protein
MITANESDHQRAYAESLGVDLYLNKPVLPGQLFESVNKFCPLFEPGPHRIAP